MKGILLISHGKLSLGMLDTLKMFSGDIPNIEALSLLPEADLAVFSNEISSAIGRVNQGSGVVVFVDLIYGTPCNLTAKHLIDEQLEGEVTVVTGMNLPMILEYIGMRESNPDISCIISTGQEGIVDFGEMYKNK